jgi:tetratricopeptide (TPR) repeat protein
VSALIVAAALLQAAPAPLQSAPLPDADGRVTADLSAGQVLALATSRAEAGDLAAAVTLFSALARDPDIDIRSEARFRHGRLLEAQRRFADAAVLYRAILDELPGAQRVRLQLAQALLQAGDEGGARRALRQAQAGGLPPDVTRIVAQFQSALRAVKPIGGSLELALAPNNNINRATRSNTLDTVIAPFVLSDDARAQSGVGVKLAGQGYVRLALSDRLRWTLRASGQGYFYRQSQFADLIGQMETGLEYTAGRSRLQPSIGRSQRWFGGRPFVFTDTASLNWLRALGRRSQLDVGISVGQADFRQNDLQDGTSLDLAVGFEHAFSPRSGGRLSVVGQRQGARDPGYATAGGGMNLLHWREMGRTTAFVSAGLSYLEGDARIALFPRRRLEWLARGTVGATFRQLSVAGFAPVVRVSHERNISTIALFDFARTGVDIGITRAF